MNHANQIPWMPGTLLSNGQCNIYITPEGLLHEPVVLWSVVQMVDDAIEAMICQSESRER